MCCSAPLQTPILCVVHYWPFSFLHYCFPDFSLPLNSCVLNYFPPDVLICYFLIQWSPQRCVNYPQCIPLAGVPIGEWGHGPMGGVKKGQFVPGCLFERAPKVNGIVIWQGCDGELQGQVSLSSSCRAKAEWGCDPIRQITMPGVVSCARLHGTGTKPLLRGKCGCAYQVKNFWGFPVPSQEVYWLSLQRNRLSSDSYNS